MKIKIKPEPLPNNWADNLIKSIIWGNNNFWKK